MRVFLLVLLLSLFQGCQAESEEACDFSWCSDHGVCIRLPDNTHRCHCWNDYYGKACEEPRCLNNGVLVLRDARTVCSCPEGFTGDRCEVSNHICFDRAEICGENGKCVPESSNYFDFRCLCERGFTGKFCKNCSAGFFGKNCEFETNLCLNNPCINGRCVSKGESYSCECWKGYAGRHCEMPFDPCFNVTCKNHAPCIALHGTYFCMCPPGFTGRDCDFRTEPCLANYCKNGGSCSSSLFGSYCACPFGFKGAQCEHQVSFCDYNSSVCQNGGTCVSNNGGYDCICVSGWEGKNCEINVDDCVDALCAEGSTCIDRIASYACECPVGKIGSFCNLNDPCLAAPCKEGSQCFANPVDASYQCRCQKGFTGPDCSIDINECETGDFACLNEGFCVNTRGSWMCKCAEGFSGAICEERIVTCSSNPCLHGGSCLDYNAETKCICTEGFYGKFCEKRCSEFEESCKLQKCNGSTCLNGGQCVRGVCLCPPTFTGRRCEQVKRDPCVSFPCGSNGRCKPTADGIYYTCECEPGFFGVNCSQKDVNECEMNGICKNGGSCQNLFGTYKCLCKEGYGGANCEKEKKNCDASFCLNGGHCVEASDGFRCRCLSGFTGIHCELITNSCTSTSCENGGTCQEQNHSIICQCPIGFSGRWCQKNNDDCFPGSCFNDGICIDGVNAFHCICKNGFTGERCEIKVDYNEYAKADTRDKESCRKNDCDQKALNGVCDPECNFFACHYDGGDCSARNLPFENCPQASFCARSFHNSQCDPVCNNEDCLFDGRDCDVVQKGCLAAEVCSKVSGDGKCDRKCNNAACGWDGGDCYEHNGNNTKLDGYVSLVLLVSPQFFEKQMNLFLFKLSQLLRASVSIKKNDGRLMIREWDSENGNGNVVNFTDPRLFGQSSSFEIDQKNAKKQSGIVVDLLIDTSSCQREERGSKCFSNISSVKNYLGAASAKKVFDEIGLPVYSASSYLQQKEVQQSTHPVAIILCVFCVCILGSLFGVAQFKGKRRYLNAPIWKPPMNPSGKSSSTNIDSFSIRSDVLYPGLDSPKRMRMDIQPIIHTHANEFVHNLLKPGDSNENCEWTTLHEEAILETPLNAPVKPLLVNAKGMYGHTALMLVVLNDKKDDATANGDIEQLVSAGAALDLTDDEGSSALFHAVKKARLSLVKVLLSKGADVTLTDTQGRTVLHHAVAIDYPDMVETILGTNVNIDAYDCCNQTALIYAARFGFYSDIAERLLQANADPSCTGDKSSIDFTGRTALHFAAQSNNLEVIRLLVNHGANKDAQDQQEQTPLFLAALEGRIDAVKLLISLGASKDICDQKERSPRDVAAERKYQEIVVFLDGLCSQRVPSSRFAYANVNYTGQCNRQKKANKKVNSKQYRKILPPNLPLSGSPHSAVNPLTPPLSDGSNHSTTPSPNGLSNPGLFDIHRLHGSSVMLSPQFETCNNAGWSPEGNSHCAMSSTSVWPSIPYYEYSYTGVHPPSGYCNV